MQVLPAKLVLRHCTRGLHRAPLAYYTITAMRTPFPTHQYCYRHHLRYPPKQP